MTRASSAPTFGLRELGKFLEIQNLGLNLPFAIAMILAAARGLPTLPTGALIVVAFVAARNAGHSFNRWADRRYDALNPRTQSRALVAGRISPSFALVLCAANSAILVIAAGLLNLLSLILAPVALGLIFAYSYTKRFSSLTTTYLGLIEGITPAAVFIAVTGTLPYVALVAVGALVAWGSAFETIHSLGEIDADRATGLKSIPVLIGLKASVTLAPALHGLALVLFAFFGSVEGYPWPYYLGLAGMATVVVFIDWYVAHDPERSTRPFRLHFVASALFLVGVALALAVSKPL